MTREEAIAELQRERKALLEEMEHDTEQWCKDYIDALGIALNEMQGLANNSPKVANENDELISRRAAGKIICDWCGICPKEKRNIMECDDICPQFAKIPAAGKWILCSERMPACEQEVLICTEKRLVGRNSMIDSIITPAIYEDGTMLENDSIWTWYDMDWDEWDDEEDCGIIPEGWWENRHFNPDECYNSPVDRKVVAWMPLPDPYKERV